MSSPQEPWVDLRVVQIGLVIAATGLTLTLQNPPGSNGNSIGSVLYFCGGLLTLALFVFYVADWRERFRPYRDNWNYRIIRELHTLLFFLMLVTFTTVILVATPGQEVVSGDTRKLLVLMALMGILVIIVNASDRPHAASPAPSLKKHRKTGRLTVPQNTGRPGEPGDPRGSDERSPNSAP